MIQSVAKFFFFYMHSDVLPLNLLRECDTASGKYPPVVMAIMNRSFSS